MKRLCRAPPAALAGRLDSHSNAAKHSHRTAQLSPSGCAGSSKPRSCAHKRMPSSAIEAWKSSETAATRAMSRGLSQRARDALEGGPWGGRGGGWAAACLARERREEEEVARRRGAAARQNRHVARKRKMRADTGQPNLRFEGGESVSLKILKMCERTAKILRKCAPEL